MVINQGLGGPKGKPRGVLDGQWVNIPTLEYIFNKLRNVVILADNWISRSWSKEQSEDTENSEFIPEIRVSALARKGLLS